MLCPYCEGEEPAVEKETIIEKGVVYHVLTEEGGLVKCLAAEQVAAPDAAEMAQQHEAIRRFNRVLLAIGPVLNPPRG